jgi:hypothetical protein
MKGWQDRKTITKISKERKNLIMGSQINLN